MIVRQIRLKNFRNYNEATIKFDEGINVIYGLNAQGKTNLVEGVYFSSLLNSFRTSDEKSLIQQNKDNALLELVVGENEKNKKIKITLLNKEKNVFVDNEEYKRLRDYIGNVTIVCFCSDDIKNFKTSPKERRKFFDVELSKVDKNYVTEILMFRKVLKQRNDYLKKQGKFFNQYIEVIDQKLCELSKNINKKRNDFIDDINKEIKPIYNELTQREESICVKYDSFINETDDIESLKEKYFKSLEKDKEKGITNIGIHKDDYKCLIKEKNIEDYASSGQQRLALLSIKLAVMKILEKEKSSPIVILDDVFSELDEEKKQNLLKYLTDKYQTFITTVTNKYFIKRDQENINYIYIVDGKESKERIEKND